MEILKLAAIYAIFAMKLVRRVLVIHFGEKMAEGSPAVVVRDPKVLQAYLGERKNPLALV